MCGGNGEHIQKNKKSNNTFDTSNINSSKQENKYFLDIKNGGNLQNKVGSQNELDEKIQEEDYEIDEYTKTKHNKNELHKISNDAKVTKVQKQEHNVIEQIVLSLNKTDKRGNNVKTLKEAFPPEAIEDLGIGLDFFEHDAVKAHSNTADDLKMAIEKVKTVLPYLNGEQSYTEPGVFEDIVNVMLELYESTTAYCYTHLNDSSKEYAQKRFDNAAKIKLALGTVIENSKWIQKQEPLYEYLDKPEEEKSMSPEELEKYKKDNKKEYNKEYKEYTTAKKQLLELSSTYIKWNKNVIRDKFDTPEQKMKHRLDMLDTYKIYFQRYLKFRKKTGRTTEIPFEIKWMMNERKNAIEGLRFVAWAKRNGNASKIQSNKDNIFLEKRVRNEESVDYSLVINEDDVKEEMEMESTLRKRIDKGLTEEQSQAVDRIDRWLIRNYRNGGMAGTVYGGMRNNNSQFVMKLLSMSKRERLYIYYMIETGARKAPSDEDLLKSQSGKYIPDKDKFKSQMIATKFKFTARFFGDYVYWHKLDQAMELLSIRKAELVEAYAPKKKTKAYTAKEKKRETYSKELIQILSDYKSIIMNPNKLPKEAIKEITAAQAARMKELTIKLTGECLEFEQEADQKRGVRFNPTEVEQTQANVDMLLKVNRKDELIYGMQALFACQDGVFDFLSSAAEYGGDAIAMVGSAISLVSQVAVFAKNFGSNTKIETTSNLFSVLYTGSLAIQKGYVGIRDMSNFIVGQKEALAGVTDATYVGLGQFAAGASIGLRAFETISQIRKSKYNSKLKSALSSKYKNKEMSREDKERRYDEKVANLIGTIQSKNKTVLAINSVSTGFLAASTFIGPWSIVNLSIGVVAGMVGTIVKSIKQTGVVNALFDGFYGVNDIYKEYMAQKREWKYLPDKKKYIDKYEVLHDESELKAANEKDYLAALRMKIAQMRGFTSVRGAVTMIGSHYAKFVIKKLFTKPYDKNREMYISMVKALGLKFKDSDDPDEQKPKIEKLAIKMTGRV